MHISHAFARLWLKMEFKWKPHYQAILLVRFIALQVPCPAKLS